MLDGSTIPQQLIGNAALTAAFILVAWALLREAARWVIKGLVVFGIVVGVALLVGLLDNTAASGLLYWVGAWISDGVMAAANWLSGTWSQLTGVEETAA
ncbi:MAG: hypothetical protein M8860_05380 [marine benthic group bacterium]|nr:hypothetical protein [Candidatus Carthagonibacter metallireducens]